MWGLLSAPHLHWHPIVALRHTLKHSHCNPHTVWLDEPNRHQDSNWHGNILQHSFEYCQRHRFANGVTNCHELANSYIHWYAESHTDQQSNWHCYSN